jgi:hypothetical protein
MSRAPYFSEDMPVVREIDVEFDTAEPLLLGRSVHSKSGHLWAKCPECKQDFRYERLPSGRMQIRGIKCKCHPDLIANALSALAARASAPVNGAKPPLNSLNSLNSFDRETKTEREWPQPLAGEAFHGIAGEIVRTIEPETEADSAAILISLLVAFGNLVGRGPHCRVGATRHHANLYAAVVGRTGEARKGTSYDPVEELLRRIMPVWADNNILNGLSSGEGLILTVCDAIERRVQVKDKKTGRMTMEFDTLVEREGVEDKRQLVVETELASLLKVMSRQGNTISPVLRVAWDGGRLQSVVKNNPMKATGAHISLIGHITPEELTRSLTEMEAANGFGNRILWVCSRRSKLLPEGGDLPEMNNFVRDLRELADLAGGRDLIRREEAARQVWAAVYPALCTVPPGLAGTLTARGAAQVLRLSLVYALLDGLNSILVPHVLAALAVWDYCGESVQLIFGDATGDPLADTLYEAMRSRPEMVPRTALHQIVGNNRLASELDASLASLLRAGKVRTVRMKGEGGREVECWQAVAADEVPVEQTGTLSIAKAQAQNENA